MPWLVERLLFIPIGIVQLFYLDNPQLANGIFKSAPSLHLGSLTRACIRATIASSALDTLLKLFWVGFQERGIKHRPPVGEDILASHWPLRG